MVTLFTLVRLFLRDELFLFVALLRTLLLFVSLSTSTNERLVNNVSGL